MQRTIFSFLVVALLVPTATAQAVEIPVQDLESFTSPCTLSVSQNGSVRTLSWSAVSGASSYKVGYRTGGTTVGLAELSGTSYDHTGWDPDACLEYVLVAYDSGGAKICAAHVENVGGNCPK
jgi:hypothetical protein